MRIAIVGSRDYPDLREVALYVKKLPDDTVVVSGGAKGVDTIAQKAAEKYGLESEIYYPDPAFGYPGSFFKRNEQIAADCDKLVAFWHNGSNGTRHAISCAQKLGKKVEIYCR